MTFEELKKNIINMQRSLDINEYLWYYIKAQSFDDIIQAVKKAENFVWNWEQGFYAEDILSLIPDESLMEQNVFYKKENLVFESVEEEDTIPSFILLIESSADVSLRFLQKTKIVCVNSLINNLSLYNNSYINLQLVGNSKIYNAILDKGSYAILKCNNNSLTENIEIKDDSILKIDGYDNSIIKVKIDDGFVNAYLQDKSSIILENGNDENTFIQLLDMATKSFI